MSGSGGQRTQPFGSIRNSIGLGPKISAVMVTVLAVLGIVTAIVVHNDQSGALHDQFIDRGIAITRVLEVTATDYVTDGRHAALSERLQALNDLNSVRYIIVTDQGGAPIASSFDGLPPMGLVQVINAAGGKGKDVERVGSVVVTAVKADAYDVLNVSSPLDVGYVHVGMDQAPIRKITRASLVKVLIIFLLFVLFGATLSIFAGQMLARPLADLMQVSTEVSAGNLRVRAEVTTRDEFATFGASLNAMVNSLRNIVGGVRRATTRVSEAAADIVMSSKSQETGVAEQTASIDEVTHSMQSLTATANAIAGRSQELSGLGQRMSDQLRQAQGAVDAAGGAMRDIAQRNASVSTRVQQLYEHSRAIISVIDIIENISDRLDLLALNAALEGARAGDVGKGFSLVATEMRRLAESVMLSTREVKETIAVIGEATRTSLAASRDSSEATKNGVAEMDSMVRSTAAMFTLIEQAVGAARQIYEITQQQLSSSTQVSAAMAEITAVSTSATGLAQEVTRAATQLSEIATVLENEVSTFQLGVDT